MGPLSKRFVREVASKVHSLLASFVVASITVTCMTSMGCASKTPKSLLERVTLAPTAVTIPLEREHRDVVDARAPLDTFVCLRFDQERNLELKLEVDESLEGELLLLSPAGEVLDKAILQSARRFYSVRGWASPGNPSQCAQIRLQSGWSMISLKWRIR